MPESNQKKYRRILGELDQVGYVIHINRVCGKRYELQVNWEIKKQYRKRDSCNKFILKIHKKVTMSKEKKVTEVLEVPIHFIITDINNPRANWEEDTNIELAKSIKVHGLLQPIMIRPKQGIEPLKYVVVYGHRRLWAARYLKWETIPAQVKEMSDDEAFEFQIIENLQREDVNPMDESDAFQKLVNKGLFTAEMIADKIGKSPKYVYDRLILQQVIPNMQSAVRVGKFTITHAKQLARITPEDQNRLWQVISNKNSQEIEPAYIRRLINDTFKLKLGEAIFPTGDSQLVPSAGSCLKCNKHSGCRQLLFEEVKDDDVCFDIDCYKNKETAYIDRLIDEYKSEGKEVKLLTAVSYSNNELLMSMNQWQQRHLSDDDTNSNTIGIIVEVPSWQQNKFRIGEIKRLSDDIVVEPIEELEADNKSETTKMTKGIQSLLPSNVQHASTKVEPSISKDLRLILLDKIKHCVEEELLSVEHEPMLENILEFIILHVYEFNGDFLTKACEKFGWEIVREVNTFWIDTTKKKLIEINKEIGNLKGLFIFLSALYAIDYAYYSSEDIERIETYFPMLGAMETAKSVGEI
jgi:ParB/RepB/Spo0J family partition protein